MQCIARNISAAKAKSVGTVLASLLFAALSMNAPTGAAPPAPVKPIQPVDFSRDIRPILAINCFTCHGSDPQARQAGLRLDQRDAAISQRASGRAIEPGKPEMSAIIARINSASADLIMPPASSQHKLTPEDKRMLERWVRQGAPYADHWAFTPLVKPKLPVITVQKSWVHNPIDSFVLSRLQKAGLTPAPEADRCALIRRLSLDLVGLPPTPSDVSLFLNDRSGLAYEHAVDRLLASQHYGEHWARMWLDLMRYADTQGYEKDGPRTIWRYRDWVIDAFNSDMPYSQFTIEQLAGDLLPNSTPSQLLATACHRNTMTNTEGGVDGEEFRVAAIKDRVDSTGQVWMGLTIGCAKCHSHKYDPISQQEYYRFYALFNQTADANNGDDSPNAPMPSDEQKSKIAALDAKLITLRETFNRPNAELDHAQGAWENSLATTHSWNVLPAIEAETSATSGAKLTRRADEALLVSGPHKEQDSYTLTYRVPAGRITAIRLEALKDSSLPNGGPGRDSADQNVVTSEFSAELITSGGATPLPLTNARADFEQGGWPISAAIDGKPDTGWAFSPQNTQPHVAIFDLKSPLTIAASETDARVRVTVKQNYARLQFGCLRIGFSSAEVGQLKPALADLSDLAARPVEKRTAAEQQQLKDAFRQSHGPTEAIWKEIAAAAAERKTLDAAIPKIPIMRELPVERQRITRLHKRGNFMDPGDVMAPAVPAAFGSIPAGLPQNRLGAAQWIVSRSNPLTARVAVNRIWARMFGLGIVETEEDFGTQGTVPSNSELLNWLAADFRDDLGWSIKRLCREIVLSSTYRQAAVTTPIKKRLDPRNVLLSRGPRFRLTAEMIRDQALAVSGLLSDKVHGPSVMPPQPDGIWRTVYSGLAWKTSPGEDRYRRGLYTFWRRSSPYPAMTTFDAGSGEFCVVRRIRTNTPLQALVTLNDPAFIEAAGALAGAMMRQTPGDVKSRMVYGFRRVLVRAPDANETARLLKLFTESAAQYRSRTADATALVKAANPTATALPKGVAEAAAWVTVSNVLLNLDETVMKP